MDCSEAFEWKFYRVGGLDQVTLRTAEELRHLDDLDPKLWVVLSMPVNSVRFDARTLKLLDTDEDGRIRVPEVKEAVRWTVARLKDPASMVEGMDALPLDLVRDDNDEGRQILASARRMLIELGIPDATVLTAENASKAAGLTASLLNNGDGVIPLHDSLDEDMKGFVRDVMASVGSVPDACGLPGVSQELADRFVQEASASLDWDREREEARDIWPLGAGSEKGYQLMKVLKPKIEDYFLRCDLAAYDDRAEARVNAPEAALEQLGSIQLAVDCEALAALPLAKVSPDRPLPLLEGINPAWNGKVRDFCEIVVTPLLGQRDSLSREDWHKLEQAFAAYDALMAKRPANPTAALGMDRLRQIMDDALPARFAELVARDLSAAPEVANMHQVEKLVLFHQHLHRLLMNFVSFIDFYDGTKTTPFEIGTLFIDSRSTRLCLRVDSIDAHSAHTQLSFLCLVYCTCTRKDSTDTMNIVAAITAGSQDRLTPGRHGVFVDASGTVWDATLVKIVDNPISIRTAMTSPYRRVARMIGEQVQKFATSKEAAILAKADKLTVPAPPAPPPPATTTTAKAPFDIGRSAGIFAAIGLALGAIGTALASIAASLMSLSWWQFPLLLLGILAVISGPSMFLAWLKLRKRALGPVLDASGWAVNSRIPVNFMLGRIITDTAVLPPNTDYSYSDPLKKPGFWKLWMTVLVVVCFLIGCGLGGWWAWKKWGKDLMPPAPPVVEKLEEAAPAAPATVPVP